MNPRLRVLGLAVLLLIAEIAAAEEGPVFLKIEGQGKWHIGTEVDPVTDTNRVMMFLYASSGKSAGGNEFMLGVRCFEGKTDLWIDWRTFLGTSAEVLVRVDKRTPVTSPWGLSSDKSKTFHREPVPFIKGMLASKRLVAQVTPYRSGTATAIFDITGLEKAIAPLRKECGW